MREVMPAGREAFLRGWMERDVARLQQDLAEAEDVLRAIVIEAGGKAIPNESLTACRSRALAFLELQERRDG